MIIKEEEIISAIAHQYNLEVSKQIVVNSVATKYVLESSKTEFKLAITENIDNNEKEQLEINGYEVLQAIEINYNYLENVIKEYAPNANKKVKAKDNKPSGKYLLTKL